MSEPQAPEPLFIANNLALDFINTAYGTGGNAHDVLTDDSRVLAWLQAAGVLPGDFNGAPAGLAALALELRAAAGRLVRGTGAPGREDLALVNRIREQGRPLSTLEWDAGRQRTALVDRRRDGGCSSLLEPVASAVARLLSEGGPQRVRECEAHDCTLLFEDSAKSRRRRWCSMALCGNRMKVAAYRARRQRAGGAG